MAALPPVAARHRPSAQPGPTWPKTRRWPRRLLIGTCIFLSVAVVTAGGAYAYLRWRLDQIHKLSLSDLAQDKGSVMNVLLVGSDSRDRLSGDLAQQAGKDEVSGQRSDTIMVLHVDSKDQKAALLSIPRDLYVKIAGGTKSDRINSSFASGGPQTLIQTIKDNLGIQINHYMEVDFVGFRDIVNTVGGVNVYVPAPARDTMSGLDIKNPGCIRFDGDVSLAWVRSRHYEYFESGKWRTDPSSDLGRIQRQQDFIRRMMRKAVSSGLTNPLTLNRLIGIGVKDVTIDSSMSTSDLVRVARRFKSLNPDTVDMLTLPTTPATIGGADVLRLNQAEAKTYVDRLNGLNPATTGASDVRPGDVRVRVLNGNGSEGAAAKAGADLGGPGFNVADQGDADNFKYAHTTIRYATGQKAKADLLARYLKSGAIVTEDKTLRTVDLTLAVGADYSGV
ncbi:MAG TPA: LCP family protein, partial [Acidimicrobiales bacterium]|nr:LCP family protein [Acidimicrobiales bacterium]